MSRRLPQGMVVAVDGPYVGRAIPHTTLKFSVAHILDEIGASTGIVNGTYRHYWRGRYTSGMWIGEVHAVTKVSPT